MKFESTWCISEFGTKFRDRGQVRGFQFSGNTIQYAVASYLEMYTKKNRQVLDSSLRAVEIQLGTNKKTVFVLGFFLSNDAESGRLAIISEGTDGPSRTDAFIVALRNKDMLDKYINKSRYTKQMLKHEAQGVGAISGHPRLIK